MTAPELRQLSHRFYPEYRPFALHLTRDEDRAADLLQEAIFLILKNHDRFGKGTNVQAWVKTIIRNLFITGYRKTKRRREIAEAHFHDETDWMNRETTTNAAEAELGAEAIEAQILALPPAFRRAFRLHMNGMKYKDIAALTGVPVGTAKSRVWTARKLLKDGLAGYRE